MRAITICPTIEKLHLIRKFEASFSETAPPEWPAVFIVMGSDDGTAGHLAYRASEEGGKRPYHIIRMEEKVSFAKAVNLGVRLAMEIDPFCDGYIIGNDDLILQPGWPTALVRAWENDVDILGAKLVYPPKEGEEPKIQHFGKWFSLDFFPFHVLRHLPASHPKAQDITAFPDVTFAWAGIRRMLWEHLANMEGGVFGLDEHFSGGFEDDDFCMRAREIGATIAVDPEFRAIHLESQTTGMDNDNKQAQWEKFSERWVESGRIQWPLGIWQGWAKG